MPEENTGGAPAGGAPAGGENTGAAPNGEALLTGGEAAKPGEGKPAGADGAAGETKPGEQGEGKEGAAPEAYTFTAPEGIELDSAAVEQFSVLAKELKLSGPDAQRVADIGAAMIQRQAEQQVATVKGWISESKTDKEFGGDAFDSNMSVARKAIDTFGSEKLKAAMESSGLGNHPEFVRFAFKVGKAISEGTFVKSGASGGGHPADAAKKLYPGMN